MKLIFAGSDDFSVPIFLRLLKKRDVIAVLTKAPHLGGRGRPLIPTQIEITARSHEIPVLNPYRLRGDIISEIQYMCPDLLVVASYGKIIPSILIDLFPMGAINLHPSLLPQYRGPSPLQAAILAGDEYSGVTVQYLADEVDAGDILMQSKVPIYKKETKKDMELRFARIGADLVDAVVDQIFLGKQSAVPQDSTQVSNCSLLTVDSGLIDWNKSAVSIERMIRAYYPWPSAYTYYRGTRLKIVEADVEDSVGHNRATNVGRVVQLDKRDGILVQTGRGSLVIKKLQRAGKRVLSWKDFLNGEKSFLNVTLGNAESLRGQTNKR